MAGSKGAHLYIEKREETGRSLTGKEKGIVIYHWLQVAYDSRNHAAFLLYWWIVCPHSLDGGVFTPP